MQQLGHTRSMENTHILTHYRYVTMHWCIYPQKTENIDLSRASQTLGLLQKWMACSILSPMSSTACRLSLEQNTIGMPQQHTTAQCCPGWCKWNTHIQISFSIKHNRSKDMYQRICVGYLGSRYMLLKRLANQEWIWWVELHAAWVCILWEENMLYCHDNGSIKYKESIKHCIRTWHCYVVC